MMDFLILNTKRLGVTVISNFKWWDIPPMCKNQTLITHVNYHIHIIIIIAHELNYLPMSNEQLPLIPKYNSSMATASFYSHMPFRGSGYMNSFGTPLIPAGMHPLDMMGYGSHTINFN